MIPFLISCLIGCAAVLFVAWTAGAIYFDVVGPGAAAVAAVVAWVALWLAAFALWHPAWKPFALLAASCAALAAWWLSQRPLQNRNWDPHFARLARITLVGDALGFTNVRNSQYLGLGDGTPHFEDRDCRFSDLRGVDALILTWGSPWMSHPMFVFDFGPGGRICISIEVRYRVGQRFSLLRSVYRQQELMYVVSDERDAILRRTKFLAGHDLYLYRLRADDLLTRQFFLQFASRVNALASEPRWYHGLTTNCTTSVYAQGRGQIRWDWRMIFNGSLDRLLYDRGLADQGLPFERLKELSRVNDVANRAPESGFGDYLRENLPGYSHTTAPNDVASGDEST